MQRWMGSAIAVLALGAGACGPVDEASVPATGEVMQRVSDESSGPLPRYLTDDELAATETDPAKGAAKAYAWQCDPGLYGFTNLPDDVHLPNEAESTSGVLIGWPQYGCSVPEIVDLIYTGVKHTQVTVLVAANHYEGMVSCLKKRGLTDDELARLEAVDVAVDSVWIRDYGPEVVTQSDGQRRFVDMSYYPQLSDTCNNLVGRVNDDASPTRLAAAWGNLPIEHTQVRLEGGNLQTDGAGHCFRARRNANARNNFSGWQYTEAELNEVIGAAHGCQTTAMESMVGGVIDHVDMWMTFLSSHTVLVGKYHPEDDPENAAILDRNAATLASMGYRVVRVPMPKPYCRQRNATCTGNPSQIGRCDKTSERVWATYMNSIRLGDAMAVPIYDWVPEEDRAQHLAERAEALEIYQRELDAEFGAGKVGVVTIQGDKLIPCQGSLHCTTMTYR